VFCCFDAGAPDLVSYLAGAREYLDLVIDSADGDMEIIKGTNEYCIDATGSCSRRTASTAYHAMPTHDNLLQVPGALVQTCPAGQRGVHDLGNGHACWRLRAWGARSPSGSPLFASTPGDEIAGCGQTW